MSNNKKKIELWEGYEVEVNERLLDEVEFMDDLRAAIKENDFSTMVMMFFAIVGGEKVYEDAKEYVIKERGYFSIEGLSEITKKIGELFPKAGNRAQRRSWQTLK